MDDMSLKNFRPDGSGFNPDHVGLETSDTDLTRAGYHEEMNTIKIDKLSNKITIISIIIPVMIGAILVFAYMDMKERVVDVDQTKQTQVEKVSQQLEEKLNALDIKIAKNKFEIEKSLPLLQKQTTALEGQLVKISTTKADSDAVNEQISKLSQQVKTNTTQDESTMAAVEKMNKTTLSKINANQKQFDQTSKQIKEEITLFKEEFDARLLELSDYELQIGQVRKDLSLLDKKFIKFEHEQFKRTEFQTAFNQLQEDLAKLQTAQEKQIDNLKQQLSQVQNKVTAGLDEFSDRIDQLEISKSGSQENVNPLDPNMPVPQIRIETPPETGIIQKPLKQ